MGRGSAIIAIAAAEASIVIAGAIILTTGVLVTGRAIEWLLIWRAMRREER